MARNGGSKINIQRILILLALLLLIAVIVYIIVNNKKSYKKQETFATQAPQIKFDIASVSGYNTKNPSSSDNFYIFGNSNTYSIISQQPYSTYSNKIQNINATNPTILYLDGTKGSSSSYKYKVVGTNGPRIIGGQIIDSSGKPIDVPSYDVNQTGANNGLNGKQLQLFAFPK